MRRRESITPGPYASGLRLGVEPLLRRAVGLLFRIAVEPRLRIEVELLSDSSGR